jgi:PAS domain S-box-containing protein
MILDEDKITRIKKLLKSRPKGLTISDISQILKINRNSVAKYLEILLITGHVEMRAYGNAKVYYLSQRVPFSAMLRFASELIMVVDSEMKIMDINDHFLSFFSAERGDLMGMDVREISFPPLTDPKFHQFLERAQRQEEVVGEIGLKKEGEERFFRVKIVPTVFDEGSRGWTLILEDISLQKRYEEKLRMNEARYRAIVEDQTEMICRFLPDGTVTFVNESFSRYFGMIPKNLVGKSFLSFIHEEDREKLMAGISQLSPANPIMTIEDRVILPNGTLRWNQWINRALFDEETVVEYQGVGRDITDQKIVENELIIKDSAIASSINGIGIADLNGRVTYANRAFLRMFGYEDDREVLQKPIEFFAHGDRGESSVIDEVISSLRRKKGWIGEIHPKRSDGTGFDAQLTANIVTDSAGQPLCLMASFQDISERKRAERELRMKETAISSAINGIALFNTDASLIYANRAFQKMFGYSDKDKIIGRSDEWFAHEDRETLNVIRNLKDSVMRKGSWIGDVRLRSRDGSRLYVQITASLVKDDKEVPICTMLSIVDNTSQKRIEEALRTTYDKLQDAIEFMPDPTFIVDRDNRVIAWNRALEILTGVKKDYILGKADYQKAFQFYQGVRPVLVDLIGMPSQEIDRLYPQVRRFGDDIFVEGFVPGLNAGKGGYVWGKASPLMDQDGNRIGAIESVRDITEWKRAEESLRQSGSGKGGQSES